jgi:hypothetical protein
MPLEPLIGLPLLRQKGLALSAGITQPFAIAAGKIPADNKPKR